MLELAKARSFRDLLLLLLMRYGVRCGEIVGWRGLPGIRVQDIRDNGIWIKGKGYAAGIVQDRLVPMPPDVIELLKSFINMGRRRPEDKLFPITEYWAEQIVKGYAKRAGIEDWERVGPHRLRAFFATDAKDKGQDAFTIRDLMRHKNITTTNLYVGQSSPERLAKVVKSLASQENTEGKAEGA
jgi:integrase